MDICRRTENQIKKQKLEEAKNISFKKEIE